MVEMLRMREGGRRLRGPHWIFGGAFSFLRYHFSWVDIGRPLDLQLFFSGSSINLTIHLRWNEAEVLTPPG